MSIICPHCENEEPTGALFCSECGTKLVNEDGLSTASIRIKDAKLLGDDMQVPLGTPLPASVGQVSLHIIRTGQILPLVGRTEYTIGRISKGQSILPDIDLSPYDAYSQGVSRLHAAIKIKDGQLYVEDLGSSNGTWINNFKIEAHEEQVIQHGDVIAMGRFKIQMLIR